MTALTPQVLEITHPGGGPLGWVCVDTVHNGLSFGGFRMTPSVTRDEVIGLAQCMTLKLVGHGLPTGGAKAGIRLDPNQPDAEALLAHFGQQVRHLFAEGLVLGKDMGATDAAIDGMYRAQELTQLGRACPDGPEKLRDFPGYRSHMTGLGVAFAADAARVGGLNGARVAIQGAGLVGLGAAVRMASLGARVVAMSDARRALVWDEGVAIADLEPEVRPLRSLEGVSTGREIARDGLMGLDVDLIVLAASSYSVSRDMVDQIRAPLVIEGCNMGFGTGARIRAFERGVRVIPDVIASSSSAAMVCRQLAVQGQCGPDSLWSDIEVAIRTSVAESVQGAQEGGVSVREAYCARAYD